MNVQDKLLQTQLLDYLKNISLISFIVTKSQHQWYPLQSQITVQTHSRSGVHNICEGKF